MIFENLGIGYLTDYIIIGVSVLCLISITVSIIMLCQLKKLRRRVDSLTRGKDTESMEDIMLNFFERIEALEEEEKNTKSDIKAIKDFLEAHPNADQMSDAEVEELKAAKEKLMNSAQKVFEKVYANAQAAQGAQGAGSNMGGAPEDDVVDADYKEV